VPRRRFGRSRMRLIVFLICSGIGYVLGHYLPEPWASYVSILVSYHLFLGWLVITAEHEGGLALPVLPTVLTHAACLALLIGLAMGRRSVPVLGLVGIFVPGLAPFESDWLFSGGRPKKLAPEEPAGPSPFDDQPIAGGVVDDQDGTKEPAAAPAVAPVSAAATTSDEPTEPEYTADEHTAWIRYLRDPRRSFRKAGLSVAEEFKVWQAARAEYKALLARNQHPE